MKKSNGRTIPPQNICTNVQNLADWAGNSVTLEVGDGGVTIPIHEGLIRSRSSFFDAALGKPWKEAKERMVPLPDDEPNTVKLYVHYVYRGQLCVKIPDEQSLRLKEHQNHPEYFTLAKLYIFGEKIGDKAFRNVVIDCFTQRMYQKLPDGTKKLPINKVVDIIYNGTMAGSPARKLMVDAHVWEGSASWITANPADNNKEFMMDVLKALLDMRDRPESNAPYDFVALREGKYHEK